MAFSAVFAAYSSSRRRRAARRRSLSHHPPHTEPSSTVEKTEEEPQANFDGVRFLAWTLVYLAGLSILFLLASIIW